VAKHVAPAQTAPCNMKSPPLGLMSAFRETECFWEIPYVLWRVESGGGGRPCGGLGDKAPSLAARPGDVPVTSLT